MAKLARLVSPRLEPLEDRFLPSVSPLPNMLDSDVDYQRDMAMTHGAKEISVAGSKNEVSQFHLDPFSYSSIRVVSADLSHLTLIIAVRMPVTFVYTPFNSLSAVSTKLQTKGHGSSAILQDSDASDEVFRSIVPANQSLTPASARPAPADLVSGLLISAGAQQNSTPLSPRTVTSPLENGVPAQQLMINTVNLDHVSNATVHTSIGVIAAEDQLGNKSSDPSAADPRSASTAATKKEITTTIDNRSTESQGLIVDESSLVFSDIQHLLQSLVEPIQLAAQSANPSILWPLMAAWGLAAGIAVEYLRRRTGLLRHVNARQLHKLSIVQLND